MTFDCFSFYNELDLLEIRLNVLKDVVDIAGLEIGNAQAPDAAPRV